MFYNSDILSRRETGLGVVWLAATLGNKSSFRRLTRKDIMAVNVSKACTMLRSPNEPMALRLSSQLLYGVAKIYYHQAEIWMQDVNAAHVNIRRQISALSDPIQSAIDMSKPSVKHLEAITMRLDLSYFALDFHQDALLYIDTFSLRDPTPAPGISDGFRTPTPVPSRFIATEEQITLPGRVLDDDVGVGRQREEHFTLPGLGDEYDDEGYDGLDLGLDEPRMSAARFPQGLQEGLEPLPHEDMSGFVGSSSGGWPELDLGALQEPSRINLELVPGPLATPLRRSHPAGDEEAEIEGLLRPASRRPRLGPSLEPVQDAVTELTDEELRGYRRDYVQFMVQLRRDQMQKRTVKASEQFARSTIFGPPISMQQSHLLENLWESSVGSRLSYLEDEYRRARAHVPSRDENPVSSSVTAQSPLQDFGDAFEDDEIGVARALDDDIPLELRGPRESLPWNMLVAQRRRSSLLPSVSYDRLPFEREGTPPQFAMDQSIETPMNLRSQARARASPVAFGTPSTIAGLDDFHRAPDTPSIEGLRLNLPAPSLTAHLSPGPPHSPRFPTPPSLSVQEDLRQETKNFLEYSHSVRDELADPKGFLFFSDLAPVASSNPEIAAQAFYHTLALASGGSFKVKQDQPYQEIQIFVAQGYQIPELRTAR